MGRPRKLKVYDNWELKEMKCISCNEIAMVGDDVAHWKCGTCINLKYLADEAKEKKETTNKKQTKKEVKK